MGRASRRIGGIHSTVVVWFDSRAERYGGAAVKQSEADTLKVGEAVECLVRAVVAKVKDVEPTSKGRRAVLVRFHDDATRLKGKDNTYAEWLGRRGGLPSDLIKFAVADVFRPRRNHVSANVYADWLEEHGYTEAAAALRSAFPVAGFEQDVVDAPLPAPGDEEVGA
jgi:hypothetical protein